MKKNILKFSLLALCLVAAVGSWVSVDRAITVAGASVWLVPMLWLSFFYLAFSLTFILVQERQLVMAWILVGIFISLFFAPNLWHGLMLLLATLLIQVGYLQIRKDLGQNLKIHLPKTLRMGKPAVILGLALAIASQYYFQAGAVGLLKIPSFDAGMVLDNKWGKEIIYWINPDLRKIENDNLTVDQLTMQNFNVEISGQALPADVNQNVQPVSPVALQKAQELQQQRVLEAGRDQFGRMVDRKLTGSEKVADLLRENINGKLQNIVSPDYAADGFPAVPIGMAFVLFLTVLSIGAFLGRIIVLLAGFIFWILVSAGAVKIGKVPAEMEVIE